MTFIITKLGFEASNIDQTSYANVDATDISNSSTGSGGSGGSSSSNTTALIIWPLSSNLVPIVDTSRVDFTTSTLVTDSVDFTNIASRYNLDVRQTNMTPSYANGGLKFDSNFSALVGYNPTTVEICDELFDSSSSQKIWTGSIDIHSTAHSFSCWVYPTSYNTNRWTFASNQNGDTAVGLFESHWIHYLEIDSVGRPGLWYASNMYGQTHPFYRFYAMNSQLTLNSWNNIIWTFTPSSSTQWRIRGYLNGTGPIASYHSEGSIHQGPSYRAIGPNSDTESLHYDARGHIPNTSYLTFGTQYANGTGHNQHTYYLKDVAFFSGALSSSDVTSIYNGASVSSSSGSSGSSGSNSFSVTVVNGKFSINGVSQDTIYLNSGLTYRFTQDDSSNSNHPLRFSTVNNGTHGGGVEYTTDITVTGTPGTSGSYTEIVVGDATPNLFYYCSNHSGMGGILYTNSINEVTVNAKRFFIDINFSSNYPIPTYTQTPYILTVTNSSVNVNDVVFVNVQTSNSTIQARPYNVQQGSFKLAVCNYNTFANFTGTVKLLVNVLT